MTADVEDLARSYKANVLTLRLALSSADERAPILADVEDHALLREIAQNAFQLPDGLLAKNPPARRKYERELQAMLNKIDPS